ncbi:hypothetical protein F5B22DRAFT_636693 [Xylaria bambusicola]|uniref:uncharacterized protein n=1 Tax=Xylaria bambusicola TaxID=326684 RepID=UPI002007803A|nr:uncharacterized protein F5B22DRAFT_636693 [Xylaria bambusicola]KAI0515143.1 hypothetical protein F5B22DRAFT_636693 [Xylaria bambusicola]
MQQRTRKERRFDETEKDLPDFSRQNSTLASALTVRDKLWGVLAYLGKKNPLPRSISAQDTLWLLDNTAYRNEKTGRWEAEYVAAMFSQDTSCPLIDAVHAIADKIQLEQQDPGYETLEKRIAPFVQDIKPGTQAEVLYKGDLHMKLGPSGHNGISSDIKELPSAHDGQIVPTFARVPKGAKGVLEMRTFYAEPEGWGVISDIDDTIKITQTSDPIGILRTTFLDEPKPAPGMPELYKHIHSLIKETSAWFYLSASPYNLYPFLRGFRESYFPHGTIILRDSSWMSIKGLLTTLTLGTEDYKVDRMEKIHSWLPKRKMICIGDSTQTDPESYGEIYRKYPQWVKVILIRKVEDIAAVGIESKNEPERFEKAFEGVPRDAWHVFSDPQTYVPYELIYWPGIPGRGEFIRLALEEGGADYTDTAHMEKTGMETMLRQIDSENVGDDNNPPPLAPPILRHGDLLISQTPNILLYLGPRLGLVPPAEGEDADPDGLYRINGLALTALDGLSNEVHDCHHPIASSLYYEDQKEEALRRSGDFVRNRLPKFLGYFERVLKGKASGDGPWLYGGRLTYADLVLFQVIDGTQFAFRKAMLAAKTSGKYTHVFQLYDAVKTRPRIKEYLASGRRQAYSEGIYRYYEELDLTETDTPQPKGINQP